MSTSPPSTEPRRTTALITGASAGLGKALAGVFARQRNDVILTARRGDRLRELAGALEQRHGVSAHVIEADLARDGAGRQLWEEVESRGLAVEYLVNNAGFGTFGPFAETATDETMDLVRLNVGAVTELTACFLPAMIERGSGRLLHVASAAAFQPGPLMATYYASKAYVLHFSEALSEELEGTGVTSTALCPGPVRTEFQDVAGMHDSGLVAGRNMISIDEVVEAGYRGMMRGRPVVVPGMGSKLLALSVRFAPRRLVAKFVRRLQEERGQ